MLPLGAAGDRPGDTLFFAVNGRILGVNGLAFRAVLKILTFSAKTRRIDCSHFDFGQDLSFFPIFLRFCKKFWFLAIADFSEFWRKMVKTHEGFTMI